MRADSSPARDLQIALYRRVLEGSTAKIDPELRPELPELLWLYEMGIMPARLTSPCVATIPTSALSEDG